MSCSESSSDAPINHALKNRRDTTRDFCIDRLIKLSLLQLWHKTTVKSLRLFSQPSSETLEAPVLCDASLLCFSPTQKSHISSSCRPRARRATSISIIVAAVMQNVGKTHKCQTVFVQSGYISVTLCGLSLGRELQRLFKTSAICFL